ncbi:MAG: hypothetical protein HY247_07135 [archaeon]|nr:MAG: hypothetical protein HY247_07135 [archaeon]
MKLSDSTAERISLICEAAVRQGSLVPVREVLELLPEEATADELAQAISASPLSSLMELKEGYLAPLSWSDSRTLDEAGNRRAALENLRHARRFERSLHNTPFRVVAVSGSTSYGSASRSKDLDLFCIAKSGRMWSTLAKGLLIARAYRLLHRDSPSLCFSCVMDESYADSVFSLREDPLFARDALRAEVLRGATEYEGLLGKARWIAEFYPLAYAKRMKAGPTPPGGVRSSGGPPLVEAVARLFLSRFIFTKSKFLNRRISREGREGDGFGVKSGSGHLIYESDRYRELRGEYIAAIAPARAPAQ